MSTSATEERVSGLPTNLEEATEDSESGEMKKTAPCRSPVVIPRDNQLNACDREAGKRLVIDWQCSSGIRLFADQQGWKLERLIAVALETERKHIMETIRKCFPDERLVRFSTVMAAIRATIQPENDRQTTTEESPSPASHESRLKAEEAIRPLFADVSVIRTAIMDALDSESIWDFDDKDVLTDEEATEERVKFADCIEKRIRELQAPPFNLGIKLENYCSRHAMARLPRATASTCADCAIELEKRRINHPD